MNEKKTIVELFDPYNPDHIKAYKHLMDYGRWPEDFELLHAPKSLSWDIAIAYKMAECWVEQQLELKQQTSEIFTAAYFDGDATGKEHMRVLKDGVKRLMAENETYKLALEKACVAECSRRACWSCPVKAACKQLQPEDIRNNSLSSTLFVSYLLTQAKEQLAKGEE